MSREIVEPGPQFLAPVEAAARIGPVKIVAETGYWFTNRELSNSWIRGLMVGHECRKGSEFYLELHDQADVRELAGKPKSRDSTLGVGGRQTIVRNGSVELIGMVGEAF